MFSMSSGIETDIGEHVVVHTDSPAAFFSSYSHMAKLVYLGPKATSELTDTIKELASSNKLTLQTD